MNELTEKYSPSCWVPGKTRNEVMNEFSEKMTNAYNEMLNSNYHRELDVEYGKENNQKLDIWGDVSDKLLIFIHGGYWAAGSKSDCVSPAKCAIQNGFGFASIGYGLATKEHPLSKTVDDVVEGVKFLLKKYPLVKKIVLGGHSAGAHLAFKAAEKIRDRRIKNLALFAGCYFLEELVLTDIGSDISLTEQEAKINTCRLENLDKFKLKFLILIGNNEAPKLLIQNRLLASCIIDQNYHSVKLLMLPGETHFSIIFELNNSNSQVFQNFNKFLLE